MGGETGGLGRAGAVVHPRRPRVATTLLLFVAGVGSISTALWLGAAHLPVGRLPFSSAAVLSSLALCLALTTLNLVARWFRWHFLVRRFTRSVATRDSGIIYLATLPAIVTPFFVGELARVLLLRRSAGARAAHLAWVWLIERAMDAAVLLGFLLAALAPGWGWLALPLLVGLVLLIFRLLLEEHGAPPVLGTGLTALAVTVLAWVLPVLALHGTLHLLGPPASLATATRAFSAGTLFGGATGLPLGVSITGSTMIGELVASGIAAQAAVLVVLVHRLGTAWFAVTLGLASFLLWRQRLGAMLRRGSTGHFDEIAHAYEDEIPKHVRDRLLAQKTGFIRKHLDAHGVRPGAQGLDLGCGQGWYLAEMARAGYDMRGVDYSGGQLRQAARSGGTTDRLPMLVQADGRRLPFADGSFDFVYSINALHHVGSPAEQALAFEEVARVLRPGGSFILHEINTRNPAFRAYVGYLFPLMKQIDEGTEHWILPSSLPAVSGAAWQRDVEYFTFTPDFVPRILQGPLGRLERALERSALRCWSAHYQACLLKAGSAGRREASDVA